MARRTKTLFRPSGGPRVRGGKADPHSYLKVQMETFEYDPGTGKETRWRPKKISGALSIRDGVRETADLDTLACRHPDGVTFDPRPVPFGAGGHLIASILNGTNDPENLVPVTQRFNAEMLSVENDIKGYVKRGDGALQMLTVEVVSYFAADPRIPKQVKYTLTGEVDAESDMEDEEDDFDIDIKKRSLSKTETLDEEWVIDQAYLSVADSGKRHAGFAAYMANLQVEMTRNAWTVEGHLALSNPNLAASVSGVAANLRKYAVLDYFFLVKKGLGYTSAKKTYDYASLAAGYTPDLNCDFLAWQKALILKLHYDRNNGYLKSDTYGVAAQPNTGVPVVEPHQNLIFGASGNGPEYDHIRPLKKGGSNLFSNAQLTSGSFNHKKSSNF